MRWADYYEHFYDWSESTQIKKMSGLEDFTSSAEVIDLCYEFSESKLALRLIKKAVAGGIRFTAKEAIELAGILESCDLNFVLQNLSERLNHNDILELIDFGIDEADISASCKSKPVSGPILWKDFDTLYDQLSSESKYNMISSIESFPAADEVASTAACLDDIKAASHLIVRAVSTGLRFSPDEILEMAEYIDREALLAAVKSRTKKFDVDQYTELELCCPDWYFLKNIAREDKLNETSEQFNSPALPVHEQPKKLFSAIFGLFSPDPSKKASSGRCTGNCSSCPAHYGYRYGRWYYGHHHSHGCEFEGNSRSGKP